MIYNIELVYELNNKIKIYFVFYIILIEILFILIIILMCIWYLLK